MSRAALAAVAAVLIAAACLTTPVVADEIPVRAPESTPARELSEGVVVNDEMVDIAAWEPGTVMLAVSRKRIYLFSLPDFQKLGAGKIRGEALACGILRESTPDRIIFFVVSQYARDVNTYFYQFVSGKIKRVGYDSSSFYRVLDGRLIRQSVGIARPLGGPVSVTVADPAFRSDPRSAGTLALPKNTALYSFTHAAFWAGVGAAGTWGAGGADPAGGMTGVARIDDDNRHLIVYRQDGDGWDAVWESEEAYGGSLTRIRSGPEEATLRFWEVSKGIAAANLDADPEMEILAVSNRESSPAAQMLGRRYDRAQVRALDLRGRRAVTLWETDLLKGTIPNLAIWRDRWVLPLVDPAGKKTRLYLNLLRPTPEG